MIQIVSATFEDGVLKPDEPLQLPPHARVRLAVEPLPEEAESLQRTAWEEIERLWAQGTLDSQGERLSRAQLHERR